MTPILRCLSLLLLVPCVVRAEDPPGKVILLTGFEPFGGRAQNGSWEAVLALHGSGWEGYELRARQIRVVWGAPMETLEQAIRELKPVAVFSFGEGTPDGFRIESLAHNQRGPYEDNEHQKPGSPLIIADGPSERPSSAPFETLARLVGEAGYQVSVSQDAGGYLCEECLYSLEHIKATKYPELTVLFCHVPPLGSPRPEGTGQWEEEDLIGFVRAVLEAWNEALVPSESR